MMMIEEVYRDYVVICRQVVNRPSSFSPSQWLEYWESLEEERRRNWSEEKEAEYDRGYHDAMRESSQ